MEKHYILIETSLFTATMRNDLKGHSSAEGKYIEDQEETLRAVKLESDPSPNKEYYILKWLILPDDAGKPSSVLARYRLDGQDYKTNWIMTREEFRQNVEPDIMVPEEITRGAGRSRVPKRMR